LYEYPTPPTSKSTYSVFFRKAPAKLANHRSPVCRFLFARQRGTAKEGPEISGGAAAAEEFDDGSMTAVLGKAARRLPSFV